MLDCRVRGQKQKFRGLGSNNFEEIFLLGFRHGSGMSFELLFSRKSKSRPAGACVTKMKGRHSLDWRIKPTHRVCGLGGTLGPLGGPMVDLEPQMRFADFTAF